MRKYTVHYFHNAAHRQPEPEAIEHLAALMEGITLDGDRLTGSNAFIRDVDGVTVFYVPPQCLPDYVPMNGFLIEVFDYFMEKFAYRAANVAELHIHAHKARAMMGRAAKNPPIIQLHPVMVEMAQRVAHEFMCLLNQYPHHCLRHMDIGNSFVILIHGPK